MNALLPEGQAPTIQEIQAAAERISSSIHHTPVLTSRALNELTGGTLFFKCENFQRAGAFKFRGAANAVLSLTDEEARRGVATHSSGNHAQALALAASLRGIAATIVMPQDASRVKVEAVRGYGARVVFCGTAPQDRERALAEVLAENHAEFVHPSNDLRVIAGQGTCALEVLGELADVDLVVTPVGGGGLLSGTAIAVAALRPGCRVIGAEPAAADDAQRSFRTGTLHPAGNARTIADGLRTSLGSNTFPIIRALVADIVTAREESIVHAMRLIWERVKIVVEPSAVVPLASILEGSLSVRGKRAALILSGGNVDLDSLPWMRR